MDLLCSSHRHWLLLHVEPRPGSSQRVSSPVVHKSDQPTPASLDLIMPTTSTIKSRKTFREFSNERTRVERRETFRKLRIKENFYESINGYFDWISTAGSDG